MTIFDCISTVLNSDIKQQPSSLGNLRHQRSMNDQKKKLSQEPRLTPETKPSKTFISLEEVKQSMEHYGEVIINDDPHADSDSIPRPPSQSASEILPYVLSKTLVRGFTLIIKSKNMAIKWHFPYLGIKISAKP